MSTTIEITGFGAGAHDYYRPVGEVDDGHTPGAKVSTWTDREEALLRRLAEAGCETRVGGNVLNTLTYLACNQTFGSVRFVSALGHDPASDAIRRELDQFGIHPDTTASPDYLPSVSIIERKEVGGDRMVRGRPRTPLDPYIDDSQIRAAAASADVVVVASLKSIELTDRVLSQTPDDALTSCNPGSSEFKNPDALRALLLEHQPDLLAVNDEELAELMGATQDADPFELAAEANKLAKNILCTLGKKGILLARDHTVTHQPALRIPSHRVVDTLGAGDRAHAVALKGLINKQDPRFILQQAAHSTASVIQQVGAHGDLEPTC